MPNPGRGAIKGTLTVLAVVLLLLITLALQPTIGSGTAFGIFVAGLLAAALFDWLV